MRTPFFGPAYVSRSTNLADQQLINLYPELVETRTGKEVGAFYMAPGLDLIATAGAGALRGMAGFQGALIVVSGATVYSIDAGSYLATSIGSIGTSTGPVSIIQSETQLALFDGSLGYLVAGSSLTPIALPFAGPVVASYQDGFGLANELGTDKWWQSDFEDLATWSALNFATAGGKPTDIVAIGALQREQWLFKSNCAEVWVNAGQPGFAFQRLEGVFLEVGIAAPFSLALAAESLIWVTRNDQGQGQVARAQGFVPKRISTHSLEREIASYGDISDAISYSYQQEGHLFYVLTFPGGDATWVYDVTASDLAGIPLWHRRGQLVNGQIRRHQGNCYAFFDGRHLIGDYASGNIYALNLDTQTDNGAPRKWLRSWRATPAPVDSTMRFNALRIDMQTGMGVPDGTNPQVMLRWSDDGGHTWSNQRFGSAGKTGETALRVKFNRLGSTRRNSGLDRIFELSSADPFAVALIGADLT